jgi:hypothetical protein
MNKIHAHDEELMFLALELQAKRHRNDCPRHAKLLSWLYEIFSDYGRSVARPLLAMFYSALIFLYFSSVFLISDLPTSEACKTKTANEALHIIALHNLMPLIPDVRKANENAASCLFNGAPEPLWWSFASTLQAGFSLIMWFLVALGLRNLFRLK